MGMIGVSVACNWALFTGYLNGNARGILRSSSGPVDGRCPQVVQAIGGTTCACGWPFICPRLGAVGTELLSPWVYDERHRAFVAQPGGGCRATLVLRPSASNYEVRPESGLVGTVVCIGEQILDETGRNLSVSCAQPQTGGAPTGAAAGSHFADGCAIDGVLLRV